MQYTNLIWRNGQPYSEMFDDIYYSSNAGEDISGEREFNHVFFKNNGLPERWHTAENFTIAELGFGSGLNFLLTVREWLTYLAETKQNKCLHYIAIEKYPLSPEAIAELISRYPELQYYCDELLKHYPPAVEASHCRHLFGSQVIVHFKFMDVSAALKNERLAVDAWYLDGFSPAKNAAMWSEHLFSTLAQNSRAGASCSTYTAAGFVKRNMLKAGFTVEKVKGYGKKREMLTARYDVKIAMEKSFKDKPWFQSDVSQVNYNKRHAVIIGAGIAGLTVAYALIQRGWTVTLIDKHGEVTQEASANPAAIVYPRLSVDNDVDNEFYIDAFCFSVSQLQLLQSKYQQKFWYESGLLQRVEQKKMTELIAKHQFNENFISAFGNNLKIKDLKINDSLDNDSLNSDDTKRQYVLNYKTAGVVIPCILCDVLKQECGESLTIVAEEIDEVTPIDNHWQCYAQSRLVASAEILVVANGAAVNELILPVEFPVETVRGQVVELNENSSSKNITSAMAEKIYLTPAINNKNFLGASYSRSNNSLTADKAETITLLGKLKDAFCYDFTIQDSEAEWVGFRAMSPDRVPIVGAVPDTFFFEKEYADLCHGRGNKTYPLAKNMNGLYVSLCHGSRGFTSAFLSAELICAQLGVEPVPVRKRVVDYLSPSRFIINDLKRGRL